jgi:hypothetical protein
LGINLFVFVNDGYHYEDVFYNVISGICVSEGDSSIHVAKPEGDTMGDERYHGSRKMKREGGGDKELSIAKILRFKG